MITIDTEVWGSIELVYEINKKKLSACFTVWSSKVSSTLTFTLIGTNSTILTGY